MDRPGPRFPLQLDGARQTARAASLAAAAEQLIEELLFTQRGSRLNRPDLGCGLLELVFDPLSDELRAATEFDAMANLQRWLGDVVQIVSLTSRAHDGELEITIVYRLAAEASARTLVLTR